MESRPNSPTADCEVMNMKTIDDIMQEVFCDVSDEELLRNPNRADFHNMTVKDEETLGQFMDRYGLGNHDLKRVLASGMVCKQLHFDKFLAHGAPDDDVVDLAMQYAVSRFVRLSMRRSYSSPAHGTNMTGGGRYGKGK